MPEGDTVWRTAQRLNEALAGDPLVHADLRWPSLALADLRGAVTLEIRARGKHLLHRLDNGLTLHSHLRMDGTWRVSATTDPPQPFGGHHEVDGMGLDPVELLGNGECRDAEVGQLRPHLSAGCAVASCPRPNRRG